MKILKPTLREKNRYLAFELKSGRKFSRDDVVKAVWSTLLRFLGELQVSKLSLWVMDWDDVKQKGILKSNSRAVKDLRIGLAMLSKVNDSEATIHVIGISGTLKKAREMLV